MPHYYFHVREGSELSKDTEGQDLPNVEAARKEAISASREMLGEKLLHGGSLNHRTIEIADETGLEIGKIKSFIQNGRRNLRICMDKKIMERADS